jgi:hypothetical protein
MLLFRCKPLLPASWECLSAQSIAEKTSPGLHCSYRRQKEQATVCGQLSFPPRSKDTGLSRKDDCEKQISTLQGLHERVVRLLAKGEGALLFSVEELMALKEAISGFAALIMWMVPQSGERDGVIESLRGLYQQFVQVLASFVN